MAAVKPKTSSKKGAKPSGKSASPAIKKRSQKAAGKSAGKSANKPAVKPGKEVKSKPGKPGQKKKRVYTEKELGIPKLNMITPAGVEKPKGMKKGKVFVDDQESMMTIYALVSAEKEGQIESKMMKERRMEEIREARRKEAEVRQEERRSKLEDVKNSVRKNKRKSKPELSTQEDAAITQKPNKKRVSFG